MDYRSQVAIVLARIAAEYEAGKNGLDGFRTGEARHCFISARMENMGRLQEELETLVGDKETSFALVITALDGIPEQAGGEP